jgi:hypothetical protein
MRSGSSNDCYPILLTLFISTSAQYILQDALGVQAFKTRLRPEGEV